MNKAKNYRFYSRPPPYT